MNFSKLDKSDTIYFLLLLFVLLLLLSKQLSFDSIYVVRALPLVVVVFLPICLGFCCCCFDIDAFVRSVSIVEPIASPFFPAHCLPFVYFLSIECLHRLFLCRCCRLACLLSLIVCVLDVGVPAFCHFDLDAINTF